MGDAENDGESNAPLRFVRFFLLTEVGLPDLANSAEIPWQLAGSGGCREGAQNGLKRCAARGVYLFDAFVGRVRGSEGRPFTLAVEASYADCVPSAGPFRGSGFTTDHWRAGARGSLRRRYFLGRCALRARRGY